MKRRKLFLRPLCLALILSGCTDDLQVALDFAGGNRSELENVLSYYRECGDTEKLSAAEFLIENMPGHRSMIGCYKDYYDEIDSLFACSSSADEAYKEIQNISASYGNSISYEYDSMVISADYLIRDIDAAFVQWRDGEWARHLDFGEFCEWLLPYTCGQTEPMDEWRMELEPVAKGYVDELDVCDDYKGNPRAAICRVNDKLKGMIVKQKWYHDSYGHRIYRPSTFALLPGATCEEYAEVAVRVMRSKGIPVGIDFTPQWPDRLYGHYWCVFPNLRGKTTMFNPYATNPDYPHYSHCEFAKVFRRTYAPNREYMALLERHDGNVPPVCPDVFFKDVTNEYMETADIEVPLLNEYRSLHSDVYIAVFDNREWRPVYWGRTRLGKAFFSGMGRNITYIVLGYEDGRLVPLSNPFHLDFDGRVNEIVPDFSTAIGFKLWRKYPMFQHVFVNHNVLHGGYVEASDDPLFRNAEVVAELPVWSLTSGHAAVSQTRPYRYWRVCADEGRNCDMAEMFFMGAEDSLLAPVNSSALTDGDPLTNYSAYGNSLSVIVDMGIPVEVEDIMYIRRGDGNAIMPGDRYEIYYWHNADWVLHSHHVASDIYLDVCGLPSDGLYFVRGLSRGIQDRIFTWDKNRKTIIWH